MNIFDILNKRIMFFVMGESL